MVQSRDIVILNAVRGIVEVVATHTMTKDGTVQSSDKVVPVVILKQTHSGQPSKAKKNKGSKANAQVQREEVPGPAHIMGIMGNANDDPCMVDWDDPFPDLAPIVEESQPRNTVCPN